MSDDGWGRHDGWDSKLDHHTTSNYGDDNGSSNNLRNTTCDDSELWASRIVSYYILVLQCNPLTIATAKRR